MNHKIHFFEIVYTTVNTHIINLNNVKIIVHDSVKLFHFIPCYDIL